MRDLTTFLVKNPVVPFIRQSKFAVRRPWSVARRRLLDYLLIFVREGECVVEREEVGHTIEYSFRAGEFCLLQPGDVHTLRGTTNTVTPFAHFDIFYNTRREESFAALPGLVDLSSYTHLMQPRLNDFEALNIPLRLELSNAARFRETMLRLVGVWQNRDVLSQIEAQNLASELVLAILRDYYAANSATTSNANVLDWVTPYLLFRLDESVRVAEMARRAGWSPSRFSAVFRRHFGMAPHQYLLHLRIQHAQELLLRSDAAPAQIAQYTGFSGVHHFAKTFKKMTGQTPGQFRQGQTAPRETGGKEK